jgi:hypothetical protein
VANSRIKLSKIKGSFQLSGDKKLNLSTDTKVRAFRRSFYCRDKIEFNLKSHLLEEPVALSSNTAFVAGDAM